MTTRDDVLFFGCYRRTGHFLYSPSGAHADPRRLPHTLQPHRLDGRLAPNDLRQQEGRARLHHIDGWTVLAWWDRSVDSRSGSNSAVLVRGTHDFPAVLFLAGNAFPELLPRMLGLELVP